MRDWKRFWEDHSRSFREADFFHHVGRTRDGGVPTGIEEIGRVVRQVSEGLELSGSDFLLDLCCGNGLLTREFSRISRAVVGVDFSEEMIRLARSHHAEPNISYVCASILDLDSDVLGTWQSATKVCMVESLQYFTPGQLSLMLDRLNRIACDDAVLYFSGVLDRERIWSFFNTEERQEEYRKRQADGTDLMGYWWSREELVGRAHESGLECEFLPQSPSLSTAHYRFDVRMKRT
jgi:SAM-dependent methyltransferase